ncbi:LysR family transcriptional regulator [Cupriavidus sp. CP313]
MQDELTLKALGIFVEVARSGSVTSAAARLGLAQSVVSRQVAALERLIGGALFYRNGRGVALTSLAGQLLEQAVPLLDGATELLDTARGHAGHVSGVVTIGLVPAVSPALSSALLAEIGTRYPGVRLRIVEGYSGDIETRLSQGEIDLGVVNRYRAAGRNSYRRLFETPLMLVGRSERLAERCRELGIGPGPLATRQLARFPLVLPVPPNAIRTLLDDLATRQKFSLAVVMEAGSSAVVKRIMADHMAFSVLPYHAVAEELASGLMDARPLGERAMRQSVVLAASSLRPFTQAARTVAQCIPELAERFLVDGTWRR